MKNPKSLLFTLFLFVSVSAYSKDGYRIIVNTGVAGDSAILELLDWNDRIRIDSADAGKNGILVFKGKKIAIFCDSEFFHGKDWESQKKRLLRGDNGEFWVKKISRNIARDKEIDQKLGAEGWNVLRFWGTDIKKNTDECVRAVEDLIFEIKIQDEYQ